MCVAGVAKHNEPGTKRYHFHENTLSHCAEAAILVVGCQRGTAASSITPSITDTSSISCIGGERLELKSIGGWNDQQRHMTYFPLYDSLTSSVLRASTTNFGDGRIGDGSIPSSSALRPKLTGTRCVLRST